MLLPAESEADYLQLGHFRPKPGLFERNQGHQQFHDERAAPVLAPVAGMMLPPDANPGQVGLAGREVVMPPPGLGSFAAAGLLAFGVGAEFLAGGRTWVGFIPLTAMDTASQPKPFPYWHVRALLRGGH